MRITVKMSKLTDICPFRVEYHWHSSCNIRELSIHNCPSYNKKTKTYDIPDNCPLLKGDVEVHLVDDRVIKSLSAARLLYEL